MNFEIIELGVFQSGQMGQTVNLLVFTFGGSNPSAPTTKLTIAEVVVKHAEIAQSIEH